MAALGLPQLQHCGPKQSSRETACPNTSLATNDAGESSLNHGEGQVQHDLQDNRQNLDAVSWSLSPAL